MKKIFCFVLVSTFALLVQFHASIRKNANIAWLRATSALLLLPALSSQLAAQTVPLPQASGKENAGLPVSTTPKWIADATVDLEFKDSDMVAMLDKIHEETGVTILREGVTVVASAKLSYHGPLKMALNRIADTFDYTWAPSKKLNRALLFTKRFRSLDEHPEWHEKEMLHVSQQVCRALQNPLSISEPYGNVRDLLQLLYHKLSPQQLQVLYAGGNLSYRDLDPVQTLLLNQHIYCVALGVTNKAWQRLQARLTHLNEAKLVLRPTTDRKMLLLIFPPAVDGTPDSVVMRYYTEEELAPGALEPSIAPVNLERTLPLSVQVVASENPEQSPLQKRADIRMQGGQLVDLLHALSQSSQCKITAPDYLQERSLSVWTKGCSLRLLMDLLAEQNEWEWTYTASKGITLVRHDTFIPANYEEVSSAFKVALPPNYRHYLGWGVAPDDWLTPTDDQQDHLLHAISGRDVMAIRDMARRKAMNGSYKDAAMLRIWPTQPQKFGNREELLYKDWTPQTKESVLASLFAVALQSFFQESRGIDVIEGHLTPYEKNPELTLLHLVGPGNGKYDAFGYSNASNDPNGRIVSMGFFWTLSNASAPLPAPLEEISKRY